MSVQDEVEPTAPTMSQTERFYKATSPISPSYSMGTKTSLAQQSQETPGPYDLCNLDVVHPKQPSPMITSRPTMVIGGDVPSWKQSIPGPYTYNPDVVRPRAPVPSIGLTGTTQSRVPKQSRSEGRLRLTAGFAMVNPRTPSWSMVSRKSMVVGGDVPSWKSSIPGPYHSNPDAVLRRVPSFTIGAKLQSESDLMKVRAPGPLQYGGAAMNAKQQANVDSTKERTVSCSFGRGPPRFGREYELARRGGLQRYERPVIRRG